MNEKVWKAFAAGCALAMSAGWAGQAGAQTSEVKAKPTLYTYVADWNIPREKWADMEKSYAPTEKLLDKAIADGTIVGYGNDSDPGPPGRRRHPRRLVVGHVPGRRAQRAGPGGEGRRFGVLPSWTAPPVTSITCTSAGITTGIPER